MSRDGVQSLHDLIVRELLFVAFAIRHYFLAIDKEFIATGFLLTTSKTERDLQSKLVKSFLTANINIASFSWPPPPPVFMDTEY